ncbi:hypothetical protein JCM30471_35300 [Desulfuromonas carbonis]|uniref:c-type cytochrome n=1 Tax=Desulfuromonas sp. DDH964 TaxID=1823759 RepID=UPI00078D1765|nr:c-type cytochrome [Desulfuromonas sp. DDH964]AMV72893.1 hypothetical protein DBW_2565 [Desulfuromonas sp. DDH964]
MGKNEPGRTAIFGMSLILVAILAVGAAAASDQTGQGETLFHQKCAGCHGLGTGDRPTGPDLFGVVERRDRPWLISFIQDPAKIIASGDKTAVALLARFNGLAMPNLQLDAGQIEALLAYLANPEGGATAAPEPKPSKTVGNAVRGEKLFTGEIPLANGGAPCLGCHGIAGVGLAGGANFGPDLTGIYGNYGEEGVSGILESLPFPSMEPIYATRPLSTTEQQDLGAYFAHVSGTPVVSDGQLLVEVAGGVLVLFGLMLLFGLGRLPSVRRSLVGQVSNQKGGMR